MDPCDRLDSTVKGTTKLVIIFALAFGTFFTSMPDANAATLRSAAMASANTQKGAKYVYGRSGGYSRGYDCSGLIYWSYRQHKRTLPRTAQAQYNKSHHISAGSRKPGDLVFIRDSRGRVYHVGIFTGVRNHKGYMINANSGSYRGRKVVEAPISEYTAGSPTAVYGRF
jgi:cell wall-associated NlpC family hydrolase